MCYLPNMDIFLQIIDIQSFTLYLHVQINFNKDTQNNMTYGNQQSIWQVCTEIHLDGFSSKKNFSQGKWWGKHAKCIYKSIRHSNTSLVQLRTFPAVNTKSDWCLLVGLKSQNTVWKHLVDFIISEHGHRICPNMVFNIIKHVKIGNGVVGLQWSEIVWNLPVGGKKDRCC